MKRLELNFDNIIPKPVQSVRSGRWGFYQPKKVIDYKNVIKSIAYNQLPDNWTPFNNAIKIVSLTYRFPIQKTMPKILREALLLDNAIIFRNKRPDLGDNLFKGISDALTGLVWADDSLIVQINHIGKIYSDIPGISMKIEELEGLYF